VIEIVRDHFERGHIRFAVFDFDGTLSLIREGWQSVMVSMMMDELLKTPAHESEPQVRHFVVDLVTRTTGQMTDRQMELLAEQVARRGGQPANPSDYKQDFLDRLSGRINQRVAAIQAGRTSPDDWLVPGARAMLEALCVRGVQCHLVSGTDEERVREEATTLQIASYFYSIRGAHKDPVSFSKRQFLQALAIEHQLQGPELVALGDGITEIEETKRVGGIAVGVASNEATRVGLNEHKRDLLIKAGADIIVPDFREHQDLAAYLFDEQRARRETS
jgi:phosphoglycolate phosphatase-like HAD superfamily hydrolase